MMKPMSALLKVTILSILRSLQWGWRLGCLLYVTVEIPYYNNLYFNIRKNVIFKRQTNKPIGNIILVNKGIELYLFSVYFNIEGVTWCH